MSAVVAFVARLLRFSAGWSLIGLSRLVSPMFCSSLPGCFVFRPRWSLTGHSRLLGSMLCGSLLLFVVSAVVVLRCAVVLALAFLHLGRSSALGRPDALLTAVVVVSARWAVGFVFRPVAVFNSLSRLVGLAHGGWLFSAMSAVVVFAARRLRCSLVGR